MAKTAYRIGDLSFISGLPISLPLREGWVDHPALDWAAGLPAELDALMERGELDAGPISSLEFIRNGERYTRVPDLALSSWGRIGSAVLFSRVPFSRLGGKRVALAPAGATSNVLCQWLLHRSFGVEAAYHEQGGELSTLLAENDAALLIGDAAILAARHDQELLQMDLGESWWHVMKTPMVHTVWVCQGELAPDDKKALIGMFTAAKQVAKARHAEVLEAASRRLGLPASEVEAYYALLNYDLAPVHMQSMAMFSDFEQEVAALH